MREIEQRLMEHIQNSDAHKVQEFINTGIELEYEAPLILAIRVAKAALAANEAEKNTSARQIINDLITAIANKPLSKELILSVGLCEAVRQDDPATTCLLLANGASLFVSEAESAKTAFELIQGDPNLPVQKALIAALPHKSLTEILQAISNNNMRSAACCFAYLFREQPVLETEAVQTLLKIIDWIVEQNGSRFACNLWFSRIIRLNVPSFTPERSQQIVERVFVNTDMYLSAIYKFRLRPDSMPVSRQTYEERKFITASVRQLCNENVVTGVLNKINAIELDPAWQEHFNQIAETIKYYVKYVLGDVAKFNLIAQLWIVDKPANVVFRRVFELIESSEELFVRFLFDNKFLHFHIVNNGFDLFQTAILEGRVEVCRFLMQISPNYIPYNILLSYEPDCPDFLQAKRREIFRLLCPIMPAMEANHYVSLTIKNSYINSDDAVFASLQAKFTAVLESIGIESSVIKLRTTFADYPPLIPDEVGEVATPVVTSNDEKIAVVANYLYASDACYDLQQKELYNYQYMRVLNAVLQWAIINRCSNPEYMLAFINNLLFSQVQLITTNNTDTALRHEINYGSDVKRGFELILYFLEYADNSNSATEIERLKPIINNLLDQIHTCGMGARQAIQDCLTEIDRENIQKWMENAKLDLIKRIIVHLLGLAGTNTHIVTWSLQHLHAQGYIVPIGILENTVDELFDISTVFETPEEVQSFGQNVCSLYAKAMTLQYLTNKASEQLINLFEAEHCLVEELNNSAHCKGVIRSLGLTFTDPVDNQEKVFADIFQFGPAALRMRRIIEIFKQYSDFNDPELVRNWTIRIYGPNEQWRGGIINNNYLFFNVLEDGCVDCTLSFIDEKDEDAREVVMTLSNFKFIDDLLVKDLSKINEYLREFIIADTTVNTALVAYRVTKALNASNLLNTVQSPAQAITPRLDIDSSQPFLQLEIMHASTGMSLYLHELSEDRKIISTRVVPTRYLTAQELQYLFRCLRDYDFHLTASLDYDPSERFLGLSWIERFFDGRAVHSYTDPLLSRPDLPTPTPSPDLFPAHQEIFDGFDESYAPERHKRSKSSRPII